MNDGIKISELTQLTELNGRGIVPIVDNNETKQINIVDLIYPIGSIYMSVNSANPSTLFGGTWVSWGSGRVPVGVNTSDTDFNIVEKTGGEKTHKLTINEMPSHNHDLLGASGTGGKAETVPYGSQTTGTAMFAVQYKGGNQAHNILQPYITCYMWKRTA